MPNALTKKLGPLPTWAWVAGGLLFVGMVIYFRRTDSETSSETAVSSTDTGQPSDPISGGPQYIGSSDGSLYGGGASYDPGSFDSGTPVGFPPDSSGSDFLSSLLAGMAPAGGYYPAPTLYEPPTNPYQTNPEPTTSPDQGTQAVAVKTAAPAPASSKQQSFKWDGVTYRSGDQGKFRAYLKRKGLSYASWASKHPTAARDVFGTMR